MVWAGTQTISNEALGKSIKIVTEGLDADTEEGDVIDVLELINNGRLEGYPTNASIYSASAHATEVVDTVSLKLFGSVNGIEYDELAEITDSDLANADTTSATSDVISATAWLLPYRYFKITAPTVGLGNTNQVTTMLKV